MKKVIITGFEPFGLYLFNPTQDIADWYNTQTLTGDEQIIGLVLPCTYKGAFEKLSKVIDREKPDAIISIGLSSSVGGIRIETLFQNRMFSKYADANGYKPNKIRVNAKRGAQKTLRPFSKHDFLCEKLGSKGIPVEVSENADTFICNSLAYLTTEKILNEGLNIRNMFVHIPWTDNYKESIILDLGKIFLPSYVVYDAINILIANI